MGDDRITTRKVGRQSCWARRTCHSQIHIFCRLQKSQDELALLLDNRSLVSELHRASGRSDGAGGGVTWQQVYQAVEDCMDKECAKVTPIYLLFFNFPENIVLFA